MCILFLSNFYERREVLQSETFFRTRFSCQLRITWYTLQHHVWFCLHVSSDLSLCDHESCVTALTVKFLTKRFIGEYDPHLGKAVWKTFRYVWKLPDLCTSIFSLFLYLDHANCQLCLSCSSLLEKSLLKKKKKNQRYDTLERRYITIKSLNPLFLLVQFHHFFLRQPLGYNAKCETGCFLQWPVVPSYIYHF